MYRARDSDCHPITTIGGDNLSPATCTYVKYSKFSDLLPEMVLATHKVNVQLNQELQVEIVLQGE